MNMSLFDRGPPAKRGMSGHHSPASDTEVWLTPPEILWALNAFDLDPCAAPEPRPWPTAARHIVKAQDGLKQPWTGRVWLNPPYGGPQIVGPWMRRMADHGQGTALIFARTETAMFFESVWARASALLFLRGRLHFHRPDGTRADHNSGAPSVLIAYGQRDRAILHCCGLLGHFVDLSA